MRTSTHPPAVVLGGGVTAIETLRCLHAAAIPSILVTEPGDASLRSRLPGRVITLDTADPVQRLSGLRRRLQGEHVLLPCSDSWATAVADLDDPRLHTSTPSRAAIETLTDKLRFARCLEEIGVPRPRTVEIRSAGDLDDVDDAQLLRSFLKPTDSESFNRIFHTKAFRVHSREEATTLLATAETEGVEVVLQEFIEGPPSGHVFLDGFVDRDRRMNVVLARKRLRLHPPRFGNSSLTEIIPVADAAPELDSLRRVFDALDFNGPFGSEFVRDPVDGVSRLVEINGRCWWQVGLTATCGANVPARAHADALGGTTEPVEVDAVGKRWAHPLNDALSWAHSVRSHEDVEGGPPPFAWRNAHLAAFSRSDPLPGVTLVLQAGRRRLRRR